jgi:hypothetical protein
LARDLIVLDSMILGELHGPTRRFLGPNDGSFGPCEVIPDRLMQREDLNVIYFWPFRGAKSDKGSRSAPPSPNELNYLLPKYEWHRQH